MHIKQIYLDLITSNIKKHEYRLANEKNRNIKINDVIALKSVETSKEINVRIVSVEIFSSWLEALDMNDFAGVYNSKEELLSEVNKFYSKDDVEKYGIIRFGIEMIK